MANDLIERFEAATGLTFDPNGPDPIDCEYCGKLLQYIPDHDCHGLRCASAEAAQYEDAAYGRWE